ncbi:MAG: hypothetical protein IJ754_02745 [Bacteroidaceae bacterium]|nr:hypothetical protein [Bacteroidaceae bacterium]
MKKNLLLALSLVAGMAAQAQPELLTTSPWVGQPLPEESGTYYLYNVETGLWFQHNRLDMDKWTTHAQSDVHGMEVTITKLEDGGYQIDPRFGHNHSMNGTNTTAPGYLDTDQELTPWEFIPAAYVDNSFEITCDGGNGQMCLEWVEDETISPVPFWGMNFVYGDGVTWQLVTKEERLADLEKATKESPKDATWLISGWDFANADERNSAWKNEITGSGSGVAFNQGWRPNRAAECWSSGHGEYYQVIEGLPNGTYGLTLQGYYRDGSTSGVMEKHTSGTEEIRAWYFANDVQAPFMSICDNGVTEEIPDVYAETAGFFGPGDGGSALPRASNGFYLGYYWNPEIKVVVTDGTLRIGVRKESDTSDDWLVFDNFNLVYYGTGVDLDEIKANLQKNIDEAEAYEGTKLTALTAAIAAGNAALEATEAEPIVAATTNIQNALAATKAMNAAMAGAETIKAETEGQWVPPFFPAALEAANAVINTEDFVELQNAANALQDAVNNTNAAIERNGFLLATIPLAEKEGVDAGIISSSKDKAANAASINDVNDALNALRIARKVNLAETHPDVFKGSEPSEGDPEMRDNDFYLYNIGTGRFLCGGDDWGAHCAVGFPGAALTLLAHENANFEVTDSFIIDTHLNNGGELEFLGYNGYMDTGARDPWFFRPVEGKEGVYNVCRRGTDEEGNDIDIMLGYAPGTYNVVHSDMKGYDNPNNQWKLVSRYDREDLLLADNVSESNPVDASFYIACPNFDQRDDATAWYCEADGGSQGIYGRGGNNPDFAYEGWNTNSFQLSQYVADLPAGWYRVSCTGYYRDGDHANQLLNYAEGVAEDPNYEPKQAAEFYAGDSDEAWTLLPNITEGIGLAPGLGNRSSARRDYGEEVDPEERYGEYQYIGEFPYWVSEACNWFQMGFYKAEILVEVKNAGEELMICINKADPETAIADWVVVDNFRLTYFGEKKPAHWKSDDTVDVKDIISTQKGDNKVYNLQGIQLNGRQLKSGIYVKNGHKVLVK